MTNYLRFQYGVTAVTGLEVMLCNKRKQ